ncbi:hypothetical protein [Paenibacillus andongensis]|uniref:hypothetical protein n=1 Tax=Paenibacillus andongensis TaxID=2975482 RepID=UPI003F5A5EC6
MIDDHARLAFARYAERPGAVHAFPAYPDPFGHLLQDIRALIIDRTVRFLRNVEEQVAVLGNDVDQNFDNVPRFRQMLRYAKMYKEDEYVRSFKI